MDSFKELFENFAQGGRVVFIGLRPGRREKVIATDRVLAIADRGLEGDRYKNNGGIRQVTLIQEEHLTAVASFLGKPQIDSALPRRNIVVRGINLLSLKGKQFKVGEALLEYSGECHPCSRMEELLGEGGYNAMRGHGGITARVIRGGILALNDPVFPVPTQK